MKETTKKKVTKKVAKKTVVNKTQEEKKLYTIDIDVNDNVFSCETNSLREGIMSLYPGTIKTQMVISVHADGKSATKTLNVFEAKRVFVNSTALTILIKRLIFK